MGARVGADESSLPVGGRAFSVVLLQRLAVVPLLVAERPAETLQLSSISDQEIPVVVPDFMPDVSRERSKRLVQRRAATFALRVVRFGDVDCDQTVGGPVSTVSPFADRL